jgi:hypothetical protein
VARTDKPWAYAVGKGVELLFISMAAHGCAGGGDVSLRAASTEVPLEPIANADADHLLAKAVRAGVVSERIQRPLAQC